MTQHTDPSRSDTGAVLVHAALVLIGLLALSAFVIDYGALWASRRQAQNAADSGALAGAVHMLYDTNLTPNATVLAVASEVAVTNKVWAVAPAVTSAFECPSYVAVGGTIDCIRVDVYRDQAHDNPLPMFFGSLFGRTLQNVRATATARVNTGNATDCLKPFAVPDFYTDWTTYSPPGYTLASHEGWELQLKAGPHTQYSSGWFQLLDYPGDANGTPGVVETIMTCQGGTQGVGQSLIAENGNKGNPITKAVNDIYDLDPGAIYTPGVGVTNSCADTGTCMKWVPSGNNYVQVPDPSRQFSPRVFIVPVFDPIVFNNTGQVVVVNVLGFFIKDKMNGPPDFELNGILVTQPGLFNAGFGGVPNAASFLKVIQLIR